MSTPTLYRFRQTGDGYTVIDTETDAVLGTVDRLSQDFQTLSPKWRAVSPDGQTVGTHYRARRDAAAALLNRAGPAAMPPLVTVATPNDVADLAVVQTFGRGALNPGRSYSGRDAMAGGWDPLSMEGPHRSTWHLTGYRLVGQTDTRAVYVWRFAVNGTSDTRYCTAVVDVSRDPASIVVVDAYDYQPPSETTRAGAEEKAAAVLAELQAKADPENAPITPELAAELQADARAAFDQDRPGAPALSTVVQRELIELRVGSARSMAVLQTWSDAYAAARDAAADAASYAAGEDQVDDDETAGPAALVLADVRAEMNRTVENMGDEATAADYAADVVAHLARVYGLDLTQLAAHGADAL